MNKIRHYADKIYEILKQAENDGVRICTYTLGEEGTKETLKAVGIAICDINNDGDFNNPKNLEQIIFMSL